MALPDRLAAEILRPDPIPDPWPGRYAGRYAGRNPPAGLVSNIWSFIYVLRYFTLISSSSLLSAVLTEYAYHLGDIVSFSVILCGLSLFLQVPQAAFKRA